MWGSQPWNQWALQPSMFNNVPHDEIDWAALAKQWIQMQQVPQPSEPVATQPPNTPLPPPPPPPPPGDYGHNEHVAPPPPPPPPRPPLLSDPFRAPVPDVRPPGVLPESGPPYVPREPGSYWRHEWDVPPPGESDRLWIPPPPPDTAAPILPAEKKTFDYGHLHDNPPLTMQTVDYNHVSDHFGYNPVYPPEDPYDQYWSQVAATPVMPPSFLKKDRATPYQGEEESSHIDAAKRKQLPAWIREGLEKMEQERLKRLEKERADKEKCERAKRVLQGSPKKGLLVSGGYESSAISMPTKSRFDSDSENEEEPEIASITQDEDVNSKLHKPTRFLSPVEDTRTEEEKQQELRLKVRRMLTELLLDVTNSEMYAVAREVYQKALSKAPARPLASTPALRSIATGLGSLANYDSQSEASGSEGEESSSSDEELRRQIQEKKQRFAAKERKILADLKEAEEELKLKQNQQNIGDSPPPASEPEEQNLDLENTCDPVIPGTDRDSLNENNNPLPERNKDPPQASPKRSPGHELLPGSPNLNAESKAHGTETTSNSEKDVRTTHDKAKKHERDLKSESSSSSDSESDSSTSSSKSDHSHLSRKLRDKEATKGGNSGRHSGKPSKKIKKRGGRSSSGSRRRDYKKNGGGHSSDSSHKNSTAYSYRKSERHHSNKRAKEKNRNRSESSESPYRDSKHHRSSRDWKESPERRRRNRYSKHRSRSASKRNASKLRQDSSRGRHRDRDEVRKRKKDHRRSESRSPSRTPPKRYKRSRSVSSERGRHSKKSKICTRDR